MLKKIKQFLKNESGQGLVEYALLIVLLVVVVIVVLSNIGGSMNNKFSEIDNALN